MSDTLQTPEWTFPRDKLKHVDGAVMFGVPIMELSREALLTVIETLAVEAETMRENLNRANDIRRSVDETRERIRSGAYQGKGAFYI